MTKAVRRLKNFDFSGDNAAVALVHEAQSGAANGYKTLVMKAKDVRLELSMEEFLRRFFDMWWDDAEFLAKLMGYETEGDEWEDRWEHPLTESVTLLKQAKDKSLEGMTEDQASHVKDLVTTIAKQANVKIKDLGVTTEEAQEKLSKSFQKPKGEPMSDQMIEKSAVEQMIAEQIQKAQEAAKAEQEQIVKGLQAEIEKYQQKEQEVAKATFVAKAKEFEPLGVTDENADGVALALMKMADDETMKPVQEMLQKALNVAKAQAQGAFDEQGHDVHAEASDEDPMVKYMKSKYAAKDAK